MINKLFSLKRGITQVVQGNKESISGSISSISSSISSKTSIYVKQYTQKDLSVPEVNGDLCFTYILFIGSKIYML